MTRARSLGRQGRKREKGVGRDKAPAKGRDFDTSTCCLSALQQLRPSDSTNFLQQGGALLVRFLPFRTCEARPLALHLPPHAFTYCAASSFTTFPPLLLVSPFQLL